MEEKEMFNIEENSEREHGKHHSNSSHHGSSHHHHHSGSHHHHHSGHRSGESRGHGSERNRSERKVGRSKDSQKKVVKRRLWEVRWEKFFKPILRVVFIAFLIAVIVMIVWAIIAPNDDVQQAVKRETDTVEQVKTEIHIDELQAEVEELKKELEEYEEKIFELEEKLAEYGAEDSLLISGQDKPTEESSEEE